MLVSREGEERERRRKEKTQNGEHQKGEAEEPQTAERAGHARREEEQRPPPPARRLFPLTPPPLTPPSSLTLSLPLRSSLFDLPLYVRPCNHRGGGGSATAREALCCSTGILFDGSFRVRPRTHDISLCFHSCHPQGRTSLATDRFDPRISQPQTASLGGVAHRRSPRP